MTIGISQSLPGDGVRTKPIEAFRICPPYFTCGSQIYIYRLSKEMSISKEPFDHSLPQRTVCDSMEAKNAEDISTNHVKQDKNLALSSEGDERGTKVGLLENINRYHNKC